MTVAASGARQATPTRAGLATTFGQGRPLVVTGARRNAATVIADVLAAMAIVLCAPFVVLALGIPVALGVRALLWIAGML